MEKPTCSREGCDNPGTKSCVRCGEARYCSRECQKADWKKHKRNCEKKKETPSKKTPNGHVFDIITQMMTRLLSARRLPENIKKVLRLMLTIDPAQHALQGGPFNFSGHLISLEEYRFFVGGTWCPELGSCAKMLEQILGNIGIWHLPSEKTRQFIGQLSTFVDGQMIEVASGRSLLSHACQQVGLSVTPFTPFGDSKWNGTLRKRLTDTVNKSIEQMLEESPMEDSPMEDSPMEHVSTILCAFPTPPIAEKLPLLLEKMKATMICIFGWLPDGGDEEGTDSSKTPCFSFRFIAECLKCGYGVYPMHLGCISSRDTAKFHHPQTHCLCIVKDDASPGLSRFLFQKTMESLLASDPLLWSYIIEQEVFTNNYLEEKRHPNDNFTKWSCFSGLKLMETQGMFTKSSC